MFNPQHHKEKKGWVNLPTPVVELSLPRRGCRGPGVQGLGQEHSLYPVHYLDKQVLDTSVQETGSWLAFTEPPERMGFNGGGRLL
uniref:Uncharacterized protein n=1 Tax=Marmota marmota marmota TaxID=9994 RepID=A0A8C5ZNV6_MARMA